VHVNAGPEPAQVGADVLIVDDDPDVRWIAAEVLREAGFTVDEAGDGDVASKLLRLGRFRLVLLDIRMPRCDGISFVERADDLPPVIIHSAYTIDADARIRLGARVVGVLQKPVAPRRLLRSVEAILGTHSQS
jgi:DNA-binding response OmpR family regulator